MLVIRSRKDKPFDGGYRGHVERETRVRTQWGRS